MANQGDSPRDLDKLRATLGGWRGDPLPPNEAVHLTLRPGASHLHLTIDAAFHGDPAPPGPRGRRPELWNHEVVELFVVGSAERYLELEFGPHGHYLALLLAGVRRIERDDLEMEYAARIVGKRWRGVAQVPLAWLPAGADRWNAFAIHGTNERRYLAAHPLPGERPDFHQPERFPMGLAELLAEAQRRAGS